MDNYYVGQLANHNIIFLVGVKPAFFMLIVLEILMSKCLSHDFMAVRVVSMYPGENGSGCLVRLES